MRTSLMRRGAAVTVAAVAALALGAGAASATTYYGDYTTSGVKIRSGPTQSYRILGSGNPGDHEWDYCWTTGQTIYGNVFWDYNEDAYSGTSGYSSEYYLTTGSEQYTEC